MDFTRALYLGITHGSEHLRWTQLTTGTPAAVQVTAQGRAAEAGFAALVGCDRAVALKSSLHAFNDLFGQIAATPAAVIHDEDVYPVARWGMERVERRGGLVLPFRHHDPDALERRLRQARGRGARACWVVSDGFCPGCARPAPLPAYAALAARYGGRLLVDDTQAIGLFGRGPSPSAPLGLGGGGSLARWQLGGDVVLVASLAKAFGAPLAMVAGPRAFIDAFAEQSETRVHCSPPSQADLAAAVRALTINRHSGDDLRARLQRGIRCLRRALRGHGLRAGGGPFPVQRVPVADARAAAILAGHLHRRGIEVLVQRARCTGQPALAFLVTARHGEADLRAAAAALAAAAWGCRGFSGRDTTTLEA